jgi:hypothetical protein
MGVLDDAIREHLDLKRRHGAEEVELRRQEEEALGPARREVAPADSEDGDQAQAEVEAAQPELSEAIPDEAVRSDVHDEEDVELHVHDAEPDAFEEAAPAQPAAADPAAAEPATPAPAEPAHDELEDEHAALGDTPQRGFARVEEETLPEEEPPPEEEPLEDDDPFDDDTPSEDDELDDEELEDDDGHPDEDADVLEDTPDFLQETPEHDRLWFEQKPPRDFDFD